MLTWCLFQCHFFNSPIIWVWSEGKLTDFTVWSGFVWFHANMNYVHCIHGNDEEAEDDDDIEMYPNFWRMFCQPLIVQITYSVSC